MSTIPYLFELGYDNTINVEIEPACVFTLDVPPEVEITTVDQTIPIDIAFQTGSTVIVTVFE